MDEIKSELKDKKLQKVIIICLIIFIIAVLTASWLVKAGQSDRNKSQAENFSNYYKELVAKCDNKDKKVYDCCFNSVAYMAAGNYQLAPGLGCQFGFKLNTFNCQSSYSWCEMTR